VAAKMAVADNEIKRRIRLSLREIIKQSFGDYFYHFLARIAKQLTSNPAR
jgi:hypothetical protein